MSRTAKKHIGLIGLGLVGLAMAERLINAGFELIGYDIAPKQQKAFQKLGGTVATSVTDVFLQCDRVILSLPTSDIVSKVLREVSDILHYGHIIVDTSTGDPVAAVKLASILTPLGATYLDATISGNSEQVRRGEVVLMVGGSSHAFQKCSEILGAFSTRAIHTGLVGSGAQMKLVTNLVLGLNRAALAEGLAFARALHLDGPQALAIMRESMAYSRIMDTKGEKMLRGNFKPQARLSQHLKDVRLMIAAAKKSGVKLPLSETHRNILIRAEAAGLGQLDNSALIRVISQPTSGAKQPRKSSARAKR